MLTIWASFRAVPRSWDSILNKIRAVSSSRRSFSSRWPSAERKGLFAKDLRCFAPTLAVVIPATEVRAKAPLGKSFIETLQEMSLHMLQGTRNLVEVLQVSSNMGAKEKGEKVEPFAHESGF